GVSVSGVPTAPAADRPRRIRERSRTARPSPPTQMVRRTPTCCGGGSKCAVESHEHPERARDDFDIQPWRFVPHVLEIPLDGFLKSQVAPTVGLCETGDAWPNGELEQLFPRVVFQHLGNFRSRANKCDITFDDIPEVRQLVERALAEPL